MASIYKLKDRLLIHADSKTTTGLRIASEPFLPLPLDADISAIGNAVLLALSRSLDDVPHPTNWRSVTASRLSAAGVRSERSFQSGSALVTIRRSESGYLLKPHYNGGTVGDNKGFHPMPDLQRSINLDCDTQEIGSAVIEALSSSCGAA